MNQPMITKEWPDKCYKCFLVGSNGRCIVKAPIDAALPCHTTESPQVYLDICERAAKAGMMDPEMIDILKNLQAFSGTISNIPTFKIFCIA